MENVEILKKEHQLIERELIELETIIDTPLVNYPNLVHVLHKLNDFWDKHEEKEDILFNKLQKKGYPIPVKKILFDHRQLKKHRESLLIALKSGSERKTKEALRSDGKELINKIRKHMNKEDWILYALPKDTY